MNCIICNATTSYYFSKTYLESPFDQFMSEIGTVDYYRCDACGFVLSKTHHDLNESKWLKLNQQFHHYHEHQEVSQKKINQPPYLEQALMLRILGENGIINLDSMIDYAAGYGTLSNLLEKYFEIRLPIFDPFVQAAGSDKHIKTKDLETYQTVINSAMFEHVRQRQDLDAVNNLVDKSGALILHTVICETIPKDPNWFYLRPPVHTAFHTNKSMEILMKQWGYKSSLYCLQSKCWVLLKEHNENIHRSVALINSELQTDWFHYKEGFVDYWKGF